MVNNYAAERRLPSMQVPSKATACHAMDQYADNAIEADHGRLKSWRRLMHGLKRLAAGDDGLAQVGGLAGAQNRSAARSRGWTGALVSVTRRRLRRTSLSCVTAESD